ncbi:MAG: class I SAM-dependent methyltransferase [Pirellulales bacterium]|nr:class I SAM-dependent methyltransferase [Pirellulales bacterium]
MEPPAERDIVDYNARAWDAQVARGNKWTLPVDEKTISAARHGEFSIVLTPTKPVPREWFPELPGIDVLCLASGGGQQAPILAAAGANVTVVDRSKQQLAQDRMVAEREGLSVRTVQTDMRDLSELRNASFDMIFHPCSNGFCPEILPVWREAFRVLRAGGVLLAGFSNPFRYVFDEQAIEQGDLNVRHKIPYADIRDLSADEVRRFTDRDEPLEYSHTLADQIGGQIAAGFLIDGFFEDSYASTKEDPISEFIDSFIATRARKLKS